MNDAEPLVLSLRARRWSSAAPLVLAIAWVALSSWALLGSTAWFVWLLLAPVMLALFAYVVHHALVDLLNTTTIEIDAERTRLSTGPVPVWHRTIELPTRRALQLVRAARRDDEEIRSILSQRAESAFVALVRHLAGASGASAIERALEEAAGSRGVASGATRSR